MAFARRFWPVVIAAILAVLIYDIAMRAGSPSAAGWAAFSFAGGFFVLGFALDVLAELKAIRAAIEAQHLGGHSN